MHVSSSAPAPDRATLLELIDRQMWFFGCDIRHPAGNLLLAHGFDRVRPPAEIPGGTTRYERQTSDHTRLELWGWGALWISEPGHALAIRRHVATPKWIDTAPDVAFMWRYQELDQALEKAAPADVPAARRQLAAFAEWVVAYEQWVRSHAEPHWRARCTSDRPRHSRRRHVIADAGYLDAWQALAA